MNKFDTDWDERKQWIDIENQEIESKKKVVEVGIDPVCTCDIDPETCEIHAYLYEEQ